MELDSLNLPGVLCTNQECTGVRFDVDIFLCLFCELDCVFDTGRVAAPIFHRAKCEPRHLSLGCVTQSNSTAPPSYTYL